jgi:tetratricopeptide (TPR) repeat protein
MLRTLKNQLPLIFISLVIGFLFWFALFLINYDKDLKKTDRENFTDMNERIEYYKEKLADLRRTHKYGYHEDIARVLHQIALAYNQISDHKNAVNFYTLEMNMLKKLNEKKGGNDREILLNLLNCMQDMLVLFDKMNLSNNLTQYKIEILDIKRKLNENKEEILESLRQIAFAYEELNDHSRALEYFLLELETLEKMSENDHTSPQIAEAMSNIGVAYYHIGLYDKSIEYFEKELGILKRTTHNDDSPEVAAVFHNMASAYFALNNLNKSLELNLKSLEMRKKVSSKDVSSHDEEILASLGNLFSVYEKLGDNAKLSEYENQINELKEKILSEQSELK